MSITETTSNTSQVSTWCGRPVTELSREELLEVIEYCGTEIQRLTDDRNRWRQSGDALKYLMADATMKAREA
jgi:hypothetical protein